MRRPRQAGGSRRLDIGALVAGEQRTAEIEAKTFGCSDHHPRRWLPPAAIGSPLGCVGAGQGPVEGNALIREQRVETLRDGRARNEEERRECLEVVDREAGRLERMVHRVLEFSRIEGGARRVRLEPSDPAAVAREAAEVFRGRILKIKKKQVTIFYDFEDEAQLEDFEDARPPRLLDASQSRFSIQGGRLVLEGSSALRHRM